jgi:prepilin-type N-terminal cleavage/methylation domain-containing protein
MRAEKDVGAVQIGSPRQGFSLVEMLVACAILVIILAIVFELTSQVNQVWRSSTSRIQTFQEARAGFEAMTRRLGQATLNTYYDYYQNSSGTYTLRTTANTATFVPSTYDRVSDLHFISGQAGTLLASSPTAITTQTHAIFFQAPLGYSVSYQRLDNALNACGYYLLFDAATSSVPASISSAPTYKPRYRFRLMEMLQPTESLGVYYGGVNDWFVNNAASNSRILAENVIALALLPELPPTKDATGTALAPAYNYDSRIPLGATADPNWPSASPAFPPDSFTATSSTGTTVTVTRHHQLPPIVRVVMIVIDEPSAIRLQGNSTAVPAAINLSGTTLFKNATNLTSDLQSVENICNATAGNLTGNTLRLNYRIFDSQVILRDAQWSND